MGFITVTSQLAVKSPSTVVTVIVAVPEECAVTIPVSALTLAIELLLDDHLTSVISASEGLMKATSFSSIPTLRVRTEWFTVTPVTAELTVTIQLAEQPLVLVTVIVAIPAPTAVTLPFTTVATEPTPATRASIWK